MVELESVAKTLVFGKEVSGIAAQLEQAQARKTPD